LQGNAGKGVRALRMGPPSRPNCSWGAAKLDWAQLND
jgi:hypothetical protein